ncbi:MAG: hypothetical protein Q9190_006718 [Brigantiaea leucoxantha]
MARSDVILPMREPYMQQIVSGAKNHKFRRYRLKSSVQRICIEYICEISPARTRNPGDTTLVEDGLGNREFNSRDKDWEGYDFAYKILSIYKLDKPITLKELRTTYGFKSAPRGQVYVALSLSKGVDWQAQEKLR